MRLILGSITILILATGISAQKKSTRWGGGTLAEANEITGAPVCGDAVGRFVMVGTVMKRTYDDDEITPNGFVLREQGDDRTYINLDVDYMRDSMSGGTIGSIADAVKKGRQLRVQVDLCGKIYTARRLKILKP